jgi:hypothetical protein
VSFLRGRYAVLENDANKSHCGCVGSNCSSPDFGDAKPKVAVRQNRPSAIQDSVNVANDGELKN